MDSIGVMLYRLGENEGSVKAHELLISGPLKSVEKAEHKSSDTSWDHYDDEIVFTLESGEKVSLHDAGQDCCEERYMTCDDDLSQFSGATVKSIDIREGPEDQGDCECHETQFAVVKTDRGNITVETHNKHNGYYGGFAVVLKEVR